MIPRRRLIFSLLILFPALALLPPAATAQQFDPSLYAEMRWRLIGPFRGGRTVAATGVPGKPNVFYCAASNGGAWKTTDYGQTWAPIFDGQPTGSVGALAVAHSDPNVIYLGSGEGLRRPDLSVGDGIYKSTDAGQTWQHLGLRDGQQIGSIIVDPKNSDRVFVAVLGHPYGPNAERGIFRSLDGGKSWEKVLYQDENVGAIQVVFDPSDPQVIYGVLWNSRRPPWTTGNSYDGSGSGLYKSTDGGTHWQQLTRGLPGDQQHLARIGLGISPSDAKRIYALVDAKEQGGLYRSDDAGESWQQVNPESRIWGRGSDFAGVTVAPDNKDTIYVANTSTYRSTDAGHSFTPIKGAPGGDDYHTVWINPDNPQIILLASDQGATISVNGGETWSSWYNQPTAQFYHVITDNRFPYWVYGGQQESGSAGVASRSDYGEISFREWHPVATEEYGYVAPDPLDANIIYGGKATRFNQTTGEAQDISPVVLRTGAYRFNRTAPLVFSPVDPHTLYLGSNVLFKTTNGGHSWDIISPDLTRSDPGVPPAIQDFLDADPAHGKHRGVIYTVAPSFKDLKLIWIGTDDGLIQVTTDGGKSWQDVTPHELTPWSKLAMIEASHYDVATAYAAVNRLRVDDLHPYIYRTRDSGKTWQKVVAGLPDSPVNTVREDPERKGLLFAGTETGVFVSFNDGDSWQSLQLNLPATSMRDLTIHGDDLVVGTHGRSFWILDDVTPLRQLTAQTSSASAFLFAPQLTYRVRRNQNTDTPLPPEVPAGKNPPDGAILDYFLKSPAEGPVSLEISGSKGNLVRRYTSDYQPEPISKEINVPTYWVRTPQPLATSAGMHRFVWDLHFPAPEVLERDYPISAIFHDTPLGPQGPTALPGEYTVKLTVAGQSYTRALTIKMDPRSASSSAELAQQFGLESQIVEALHQDSHALQQVQNVRGQLKKLKASTQDESIASAIAALDAKAAALEGGSGAIYLSGAEGSSLVRLNGGLGSVYATVDSADTAPTVQASATCADLRKALDSALARWHEITSADIAVLNRTLKQHSLPPLSPESAGVPGPQR